MNPRVSPATAVLALTRAENSTENPAGSIPSQEKRGVHSLRVLLIEDSPVDAELVLDALRHAGFEVQHERVETENAFLSALVSPWDLILSDYRLPHFSGLRAFSE